MGINKLVTDAAWAALWEKEGKFYLPNVIKNGLNDPKDGIHVGKLGTVTISKIPSSGSIQLLKSDKLANWLPVKTGYVGIKFSDVTISSSSGLWNLTNADSKNPNYVQDPNDATKGTIDTKIGLPSDITISGNYVLVATGLASCALNTAAILPSFGIGEKETVDKNIRNDDPTPDDYLEAARAQRTRL